MNDGDPEIFSQLMRKEFFAGNSFFARNPLVNIFLFLGWGFDNKNPLIGCAQDQRNNFLSKEFQSFDGVMLPNSDRMDFDSIKNLQVIIGKMRSFVLSYRLGVVEELADPARALFS